MLCTGFSRLGLWVYKFRIALILTWLLAILGCMPFLPHIISPFQSTGFVVNGSDSDSADRFLTKKLGYGHNQFIIMYHSNKLLATDKRYIKKIKQSLARLQDFPIPHEIILPSANAKQISKDKHTAFAVVWFKIPENLNDADLKTLINAVKTPRGMTVHLGGEPIFIENINQQTQRDLLQADLIAAPASLITLLVVFGTLVAAMMPLSIGAGGAILILTLLYGLGHILMLSIFTLNIALLLGLCLVLDYSLFIISRFRDELQDGGNIADVIATTLATAGKAVFFSGVAVFISLSALLFFPVNILFSIGVGGMVAVFVAVVITLTLLPALLGVLGSRVNSCPLWFFKSKHTKHAVDNPHNIWYRIANTVVGQPRAFFLTTIVFLLLLAYTVFKINIGISDYNVLPEHSENQQFFEIYKNKFNEQELNPIALIVATKHGSILAKKHIARLYDFTHALQDNPLIKEVTSIVTINRALHKRQYQALYALAKQNHDESIRLLLEQTTRNKFTTIYIVSKYAPDSEQTNQLVKELRDMRIGGGLTLRMTGTPVTNLDVLNAVSSTLPYVILWVITLTYLILLVLLRSVVLPLKAIFMNILSLLASYGVLVFIFQEGHFHELLHFNPQGMLDVSLILIIFCALFGFSMDYEVFLLTRIEESYQATKDTNKSIIFGIVKSGRIITSAALIVIVLCGSFMVADVLLVKEFGLGVAVAIFVDAFVIRTLLVPATMALLQQWNWYAPEWMTKRLGSNLR